MIVDYSIRFSQTGPEIVQSFKTYGFGRRLGDACFLAK